MNALSLCRIRSLCLVVFLPIVAAQQYGSFFQPIYLNGAPISSDQVSCSGMGQPSYCCASGQSCALDDQGQLACCSQGRICTGNIGAVAGQYTENVQQTQIVHQTAPQNDCNCWKTSTTPAINVLPVVPLTTEATPTWHQPQEVTTTIVPVVGAAAVANKECPNGYSTVTQANVGQPTRVVNCYVIIDSGAERLRGLQCGALFAILLWAFWVS